MKQPQIHIFGNTHKVMQIEFDKWGSIKKIVYQVNENCTKAVFRNEEIVTSSLTESVKIDSPTKHPYHDYAYAPNLEVLLVD